MEALKSKEGFVHSHDNFIFINLAGNCPLCRLIRAQLCAAVRFHVQSKEPITDAAKAIALFRIFLSKQKLLMFEPSPLILQLDRTWAAPHVEKYVVAGTVCWSPAQSTVAWVPYWGRLILHNNADGNILPLRSRGSEEEVLERLNDWLCLRETEIPEWNHAASDKSMPTRVLDLDAFCGRSNDNKDTDLRLVETNRQYGSYVALSYCWGGYTACRTLKANYQQRMDHIVYKQLPPVFAQAVRVTRALGVLFLWIDALCIVQDDSQDWRREAASMSDIYWNTICRLAVNDCKYTTESFFPPEDIMTSVSVPNLVTQTEADVEWSSVRSREEAMKVDPATESASDKDASSTSNGQPESSRRKSADIKPNVISQDPDGLVTKLVPQQEYGADGESLSHPNGLKTGDGEGADYSLESSDIKSMMDSMFEKFTQNLAASDEEYRCNPPKPKSITEVYFTAPKIYSIDVDRGILNTRAWVLQERLLAPRTIHFTRDHIYCEDQDDLCGEDWVRQYFTWLSCVNKTSEQRRAGLFPEAGFATTNGGKETTQQNIWFQRSMYSKPGSQRIAHPWLRICEKFSKCVITYPTDRLAALSGLVKRKGMVKFQKSKMERNFLGLWEDNLHEQLAWVARTGLKLKYLHNLNLPSWAWISYDGPITFLDQTPHFSTNIRNSVLPRYPPSTELELHEADVPDMMIQLPLKRPASLTLECRLRNVHATSSKPTTNRVYQNTRDQIASMLPFHLDPRTNTIPDLLLKFTECHEIYDQAKKLVGFISFDEDLHVAQEIICLHISTLFDEAYPDAMRELEKPGVQSVDLKTYREPILAYALALVKLKTCPDRKCEYRRIRFAEVNHEWITEGHSEVVRLV
ncbi:MAG: hypothetical protein Q9181_000213 [Wetmoreana brouardii]